MESKRKNKENFWPSYVDIMTTLFAVMLILFAVSFARFKLKEGQLQMLVNEYKDIVNVYSTVDSIDESPYFAYDKKYLKHTLTVSIAYQEKEYDITNKLLYDLTDKTKADQKRRDIAAAGKLVEQTIKQLEASQKASNNIKFLVVIEGQSSKVRFHDDDWKNNETLSYLRALFLKKYWTETCGLFKHTSENDPTSKCEIIVAGSGEGGVPRYFFRGGSNPVTTNPAEEKYSSIFNVSEADWPKYKQIEQRNQRFLINIIPIIGNIDVTKAKMNNIDK
jgi:hypothetical protein